METPVPGLARLFECPERKQHRRNRRDLVSEILQGTTGRASETSPETGWPGRKAGALPRAGSGSGGPGSLGSDVRRDSSEGLPSGDQNGALALPGPGCGTLLGRGRERPYRPRSSGDGRVPSGGEPEQGNQSPGWRLPHPERERLPLAIERMDERIPRGGHQILGSLPGLASHDRGIRRASQLHARVDFINWSP